MNLFTKSLVTAAVTVLLAGGGMIATTAASAAPSGHGKRLHCTWHKGYWTFRHASGRNDHGDHGGRDDRDRRGGHAGSSHGSLRWERVWHPAHKVCVRR
ncbi:MULTISPECIES: hypothetical protein [unclassified Streptomyces]|uniref:hypothetical protein n=1 Tax=unclassified Streptomyces TaxID=2593676 RepID=UPI003822B5B5